MLPFFCVSARKRGGGVDTHAEDSRAVMGMAFPALRESVASAGRRL